VKDALADRRPVQTDPVTEENAKTQDAQDRSLDWIDLRDLSVPAKFPIVLSEVLPIEELLRVEARVGQVQMAFFADGAGRRKYESPKMSSDVAIDSDGRCVAVDSWLCSLGFRGLAEDVIPIPALD
jgi:hypothetical protein